jgi:hypothetical protein
MGGVKAGVGIRVQNAGCWYPPFEDRSELLPLLPRALTARARGTYQYVTPQSIDASLEDAQLIDVAGDSMVLVVAGDHTPKPYTDLTGAIMLTASKLSLDGLELRGHSLLRSDPPDGEGLGLVALPTEVGEAQEVEGLRFPFPTPLPITGRIAPNSISRVLSGCNSKPNLASRFEEPHSISPLLKTQHNIVGVANDDDIALRLFPAPDISPQIEEVMQIHVSDQRRNNCSLRRTFICLRPLTVFRYSRLQPFPDQAKYPPIGHPMLDEL